MQDFNSSREQQRAAESSRERQRAAESSRKQQRAAESSREQQRAAERSRKKQRAAENSRSGPRKLPKWRHMGPKMHKKWCQNGPRSLPGPPRGPKILFSILGVDFEAHFGSRPGPKNRPKTVFLQKGASQSAFFLWILWQAPFFLILASILTRFFTKNQCFFGRVFLAPRFFWWWRRPSQ